MQNAAASSHQEDKARRNRIRSLERQSEELLARIEEASREIGRLEEEIDKPENYSDAAKITKLMKAKEELEREIAEKENEWLAASEEAEKCRE